MKKLRENFGKCTRNWDIRSIGATLLFLLTFSTICFYITRPYKAYLSSDAAVANVLAAEIWRSGTFFPKDWWYVNGDLWILFKHALILPWLMIGQNGFGAHAFSVLGGTTLLLSAGFMLLRAAGCTYSQALIGLTVLSLGYSDHYLDMIFGEAAYSWTAAILMWLLVLLLKIQRTLATSSTLNPYWLCLPLLVYSFGVANPIRFFAFTLVPLIVAIILSRPAILTSTLIWKPNRDLFLFSTCVITSIAALMLAFFTHRQLLSGLSNIEGASAATLIALDQLPAALAYSVLGFGSILGVDWMQGTRLASIEGLLTLFKFITYPAFFLAPALVLLRRPMTLTFSQRLIGFTGFAGLFTITFLVASTSLQGGGPVAAIYTSRYITPYLLLILLSCVCYWRQYSRMMKAYLIAALLLAALSAWGHVNPQKLREQELLPNAANIGYSLVPDWHTRITKSQRVVTALVDAGLRYGYAPYWHSHPYTVLSEGRLEIRPVHLNEGDIRPWLHLSSSRWYKTGYADNNVFLLIPPNEIKGVLSSLEDGCSIQPSRMLKIEDYTVLVFESNPLLSVGTRNLEGQGSLCFSASSLRQIGSYDLVTKGIQSVKSQGSGLIHFGPYQTLERGRYVVSFDINVTNGPRDRTTPLGYVEVTAKSGKLNLGKISITQENPVLSIPMMIDAPALEQIEFRVFSFGNSDILLQRIEVNKAAAPVQTN